MNIEDISKNGIVGAGGAGFPTHIKLLSKTECFILNAAECEPLIHKDEEILNHYMDDVLEGFRIGMKLTNAARGIIGIKEKHIDIIERLRKKIDTNIDIVKIGDFYPAGDEVVLVYLATGRIIQPGALPSSVGCLVQNVETIYNIAMNKPVADKFITIAGAVEQPLTIKVPVGTSYRDILANFHPASNHYVIRSGGLMMGKLEKDSHQVVSKQTGGLIVLPADHYCATMYSRYSAPSNTVRMAKAGCDQCTFCTDLCPRYLLGHPVRPETAMRNRMFSPEDAPFVNVGNAFCCECNLCTLYSCPEGLDPKGATVFEKHSITEQDLKWEGLPVKHHPMMDYRRVPLQKLMQRLDVLKFKDEAPLRDIHLEPSNVRIPLNQHIGTPAKPVVESGQRIEKFDLIAEANGNISANIHASITGKIIDVGENGILIKREQ